MSRPEPAQVYAALGDPTRLKLVLRLAKESRLSISALSSGVAISRQGLTKHLRLLEESGLVQSQRVGRELRFDLVPAAIERASEFLDQIGALWEARLDRIKAFVEAD